MFTSRNVYGSECTNWLYRRQGSSTKSSKILRRRSTLAIQANEICFEVFVSAAPIQILWISLLVLPLYSRCATPCWRLLTRALARWGALLLLLTMPLLWGSVSFKIFLDGEDFFGCLFLDPWVEDLAFPAAPPLFPHRGNFSRLEERRACLRTANVFSLEPAFSGGGILPVWPWHRDSLNSTSVCERECVCSRFYRKITLLRQKYSSIPSSNQELRGVRRVHINFPEKCKRLLTRCTIRRRDQQQSANLFANNIKSSASNLHVAWLKRLRSNLYIAIEMLNWPFMYATIVCLFQPHYPPVQSFRLSLRFLAWAWDAFLTSSPQDNQELP